MKNNTWIKLSLFLMVILCIGGCKACREECDDPTNPDCPNYVPPTPADPCAGSSMVSAEFQIMQRSGQFPDLIELPGDTSVVAVNEVVLRAQEREGAMYTWIIGADTIHSREYSFVFNKYQTGLTVPIKLCVTAPIDSVCFPEDNGMDTVVHNVYTIQNCNASIMGRWRGAWEDSPLDTFEIELYGEQSIFDSAYPQCTSLYHVNLDKQGGGVCNFSAGWLFYFFNNYMKFQSIEAACNDARGFARSTDNGSKLHAEYKLFDPNHPLDDSLWPMHIFNGYRIN